jgi:hypothetical protein
MVIMPPADCGTANYLALSVPVPPDGNHEAITFGTIGKPYVSERLFWHGREYTVTDVWPYSLADDDDPYAYGTGVRKTA